MESSISELQVGQLVDRFYAAVREDNDIGPIFNKAVTNWSAHLSLLKDFWCSVLLGAGTYKGSPPLAHFNLPLEDKHFERWLYLFDKTAAEVLSPSQASVVSGKARQISVSIKRAITFRDAAKPGNP